MATTANIEKAKQIWGTLSSEQQQTYMDNNKTFDFAKYGLTVSGNKPTTPTTPVVNTPTTPTTPIKQDNVVPQSTTPVKQTKAEPQTYDMSTQSLNKPTSRLNTVNQSQRKNMIATNRNNMDLAKQKEFAKIQNFKPEAYGLKYKTETTSTPTLTTPAVDKNKDNSPERLLEIQNNLKGYTQTNPELFTDENTLHNFLGYDTRSAEQKNVIDKFRASQGKQTMYNNMPSDTLATQLADGKLSQNDLAYMQTSNPTKYAEVTAKLDEANQKKMAQMTIASYNSLFGDKDNNGVSDIIDTMNKNTETAYQSAKDYADAKTSPEMTQLSTDISTLKGDIEKLQLEEAKIKDNIFKQYGSLPKSLLYTMVQDQTEHLQSQINEKTIDYNSKLGQYNSKLDNIKTNYDLETARIKADSEKRTNTYNAFKDMYSLGLQQQQVEQGKYSTTASPLGGYATTNTKTGQITVTDAYGNPISSTSTSTPTSTPTSTGGGVTDADWAGYTTNQKKQIIAQMEQIENQDPNTLGKNNNPTALTRPSTKAFQDILKKYGGEPVRASNGFTYVKFPTKEQGINGTIAYIDAAGLTYKGKGRWSYLDKIGLGGGQGLTTSTKSNLNYNANNSAIYEDYNNGNVTLIDGLKKTGLTQQKFIEEANNYLHRVDTALEGVGVDKDELTLRVNGFLDGIKKTELIPSTKDAIYNLIAKRPELAKPENSGELYTLATKSSEQQKQLIAGLNKLSGAWKAAYDKGNTGRLKGIEYESVVGKALRLPENAPKSVADFLTARNAVAQVLAKMVENGRLSDQDRIFYQSLFPTLDSRSQEIVDSKIKQIQDIFLSGKSTTEMGSSSGSTFSNTVDSLRNKKW